jgi:hypothetical protein
MPRRSERKLLLCNDLQCAIAIGCAQAAVEHVDFSPRALLPAGIGPPTYI